MSEPLRIAFKEWAAVCQALATGRQSIILRKGGIQEADGEFHPEHSRFWLYPTFVHQQTHGLTADAAPLFAAAEVARPPDGIVRLSHFVEVADVRHLTDEAAVSRLEALHIVSADTVRQRFAYRHPGLFVLTVRVYRAESPVEIVQTAEYAGCKSWVELTEALPTLGAVAVLDDKAFAGVRQLVGSLLGDGSR